MSEQELLTVRFTINELMRAYREMARLSQNDLAGLSADLYANGTIDKFYTQPAIARYEAHSDNRTKKLLPDTIRTLAILFEYALKNAGFEEAEAANLAEVLQAANNNTNRHQHVSPFAVEIDSELAVFPPWLRKMAEDTIKTVLASMRSVYLRYTLKGRDNKEYP